jgi:transcriptional regulator with XRE-family HTH domain
MKAAHPEVVAGTFAHPGEVLRQAREDKGWSQSDVAVRLNLTVSSLNNLETGAFDKLPGHTFARGYIRAYAKLLGMDQTPLVQAFDQATGTNAQGSNVHGLGRIEEPVRLSHNILRIVSLLLLILVIGGGFLWWQDQAGQRGKDQNAAAIDHVEVEGADGTTRVHPIDEPQVPAAAPTATPGQPNALALPQGVPPVDPATTGTPASPDDGFGAAAQSGHACAWSRYSTGGDRCDHSGIDRSCAAGQYPVRAIGPSRTGCASTGGRRGAGQYSICGRLLDASHRRHRQGAGQRPQAYRRYPRS